MQQQTATVSSPITGGTRSADSQPAEALASHATIGDRFSISDLPLAAGGSNSTAVASRLRTIHKRDWHLWSIAIITMLLLAGLNVLTHAFPVERSSDASFWVARIFSFALPILILLFCTYVVQTVHDLKKTRKELASVEVNNEELGDILSHVQQTLATLKDSEAKYRSLLTSSVDGIVLLDKNKIVHFINPAAERLLGVDADQLLGTQFPYAADPNNWCEIEIVTPNGGQRIAAMRAIVTHWEGEEAILASLRDITRRKEAENVLRQAHEKLGEVNRLKSEFISTVSHEIRTPMTSIKNSLQILSSGRTGALNPGQLRFLAMADRNIDRLCKLVNGLLDLDKIESGRITLSYCEVDLGKLCRDAIETFTPQAEEKSILLTLECEDRLPAIFADSDRIEQVLSNLLSNAIKFTPTEGQVTLCAVGEKEGVLVAVTDTGMGIESSVQDRVFDRFYQVPEDNLTTGQGSGLGLAISRRLIEAHGGVLTMKSEANVGSCFSFRLPKHVSRESEMARLENELRETRSVSRFSLLAVDVYGNQSGQENQAGHEALARVEQRLRDLLPKRSDRIIAQPACGRLVILLGDTPKEGAIILRDRLKRQIQEIPVDVLGFQISGMDILGPATYPEDGQTAEELLASVLPAKNIQEEKDG